MVYWTNTFIRYRYTRCKLRSSADPYILQLFIDLITTRALRIDKTVAADRALAACFEGESLVPRKNVLVANDSQLVYYESRSSFWRTSSKIPIGRARVTQAFGESYVVVFK